MKILTSCSWCPVWARILNCAVSQSDPWERQDVFARDWHNTHVVWWFPGIPRRHSSYQFIKDFQHKHRSTPFMYKWPRNLGYKWISKGQRGRVKEMGSWKCATRQSSKVTYHPLLWSIAKAVLNWAWNLGTFVYNNIVHLVSLLLMAFSGLWNDWIFSRPSCTAKRSPSSLSLLTYKKHNRLIILIGGLDYDLEVFLL